MNKFDMVIENYLKLIISEAGVPAAPGMPAPPPPADPAQIGKDMDKSTLGIIAGDQTVKSLFNNIKKFGTDGFIKFFKELREKAKSPLTIKSPDIKDFVDKDKIMKSLKANYKDIYVPLMRYIKLTEDKHGNDILETKYRKHIDELIKYMDHHINTIKDVPVNPSTPESISHDGPP